MKSQMVGVFSPKKEKKIGKKKKESRQVAWMYSCTVDYKWLYDHLTFIYIEAQLSFI